MKGKANHPMEDYHVAKFSQLQGHELGLFAIYDGHLGDSVPAYLQKHLFSNILKDVSSWSIKWIIHKGLGAFGYGNHKESFSSVMYCTWKECIVDLEIAMVIAA